jgi:poly(3-hydroxybutyrate) depolymerase
MRFRSSLVFAIGTLVAAIACSSSNGGAVGEVGPEGGAPTEDGSPATSSSGGSSGDAPPQDDGPDVPQLKFETKTIKIQHEGAERYYILRVPDDYDANKAYPLVVFLHGNPSDAEWAATYTRYELNVSKYEAIVVYPDALTDSWDHGAAIEDNADSTFIFATIDSVKASHNIDGSKILLTGWSGGGFMSAAMACRFSGSFKAIGIHNGGQPYDPNGGDNPTCDGAQIPTFVTHGGKDFAVGPTSGFYAADFFSELNGCDNTQTDVPPPPCKAYDNCTKSTIYCYDDNWDHGLWAGALAAEWAWFKALP